MMMRGIEACRGTKIPEIQIFVFKSYVEYCIIMLCYAMPLRLACTLLTSCRSRNTTPVALFSASPNLPELLETPLLEHLLIDKPIYTTSSTVQATREPVQPAQSDQRHLSYRSRQRLRWKDNFSHESNPRRVAVKICIPNAFPFSFCSRQTNSVSCRPFRL